MRQPDKCQPPRPWVDWTARQIHDPVWRLRYLQSVVPPLARPATRAFRWKLRRTIGLLAVLALVSVLAPLSLHRHAASHTEPALRALPPVYRLELAAVPSADVWSVEKASDFEVY